MFRTAVPQASPRRKVGDGPIRKRSPPSGSGKSSVRFPDDGIRQISPSTGRKQLSAPARLPRAVLSGTAARDRPRPVSLRISAAFRDFDPLVRSIFRSTRGRFLTVALRRRRPWAVRSSLAHGPDTPHVPVIPSSRTGGPSERLRRDRPQPDLPEDRTCPARPDGKRTEGTRREAGTLLGFGRTRRD